MDMSPSYAVSRVRRSSPYLRVISPSSSPMISRGELAQLHVEDRAGLDLVDVEQLDQRGLRRGGRLAGPDQRDDLVDPVDRLEQPAQDVRARLGFAQPVLRTADDHVDLVRDVVPDHLPDVERARHAVD